MTRHHVVLFAPHRLALFEFGCAVELFGLDRPEFEIQWYSFATAAERAGEVVGTGGIGVTVEHGLEELSKADTIIIPNWNADWVPSEELREAIGKAHRRGARILSICSGAFLLASLGLLDGRKATTHWRYADVFRKKYPAVALQPDVLYVDEGDIVTSAGSAAGLDMLLHIVRGDFGPRICNSVARRLVLPPHREGGQAQFVERPVAEIEDSLLARLIEWMRVHAREDLRIEDLADKAAMSPRTFFRKFKKATGLAPHDWLVRERVAIARDLLEIHDIPIERVATEAGFNAVETLRYHFRRHVRKSPADYRRMYDLRAKPENAAQLPDQ